MQAVGVTPRVNGQLARQYTNQVVRLVGRVLTPPSEGRNQALIEASDGVQVTVFTVPRTHWPSQYVEVVGRVQPNGQCLDELSSVAFGDDFDLANYEQVVQFSQQYTEVFTAAQ